MRREKVNEAGLVLAPELQKSPLQRQRSPDNLPRPLTETTSNDINAGNGICKVYFCINIYFCCFSDPS